MRKFPRGPSVNRHMPFHIAIIGFLVPLAPPPSRFAPRCCAPLDDGLDPSIAAAVAAPIDPQQAVKELGGLLEQIKELWTEGSTWGAEERIERRRELFRDLARRA